MRPWEERSVRTVFFSVVIVLLGLFIYTRLAGPIPFSVNSVQTNKDSLFTVSGQGSAAAAPDSALISLGVTEKSASVADAQSRINTKTNKIVAELKKLGVEEKDIKTTNYSVSPDYDYTAGQRITGYTATQNLEVKVKPIDRANRAIDVATANGANVVGGVNFVLDDEKKQELEDEARKEAVKEARAKAESLADAAGIKLGRVVQVSEESGPGYYPPTPMRSDSMGAVELKEEPTQINPGETKVEITVYLSFETL